MKIANFLSIFILIFFLSSTIVRAQSDPVRIDIITTADTVTPPFYQGRKLPSSGANLTLTALVSSPKTVFPPSKYRYMWIINGSVQNSGVASQSNTLTVRTTFEGQISASVRVFDASGTLLGTKELFIPIARPEVYFYEINPLRGIASHIIPPKKTISYEEITIKPWVYFTNADIPTDFFVKTWTVNGKTIQGVLKDEMTFRKKEAAKTTAVTFKIGSAVDLLQTAHGSILLTFK